MYVDYVRELMEWQVFWDKGMESILSLLCEFRLYISNMMHSIRPQRSFNL